MGAKSLFDVTLQPREGTRCQQNKEFPRNQLKKMKSQNRLDHLSFLREEIAALLVVKCHMSHERVVRASDSRLPVVCRFPEGHYQRVGLCTPEVRAARLGCSHTTARIKLETALRELDMGAEDISVPGSSLGYELNWLNNEIHLLDHRKGEAEKVLARILIEVAQDRAPHCETLRKAAEEIRELEALHDEYVERLGVLKDRIVTRIDKLIEAVGVNSSGDVGENSVPD